MLTIKDCLKGVHLGIAEAFEKSVLEQLDSQYKTFGLGAGKMQYNFDCRLSDAGEPEVINFYKKEFPPVLAIVGFFGHSQLELTPEIENKLTQLKEYANQLGFVIQETHTERKNPDWTLNHYI